MAQPFFLLLGKNAIVEMLLQRKPSLINGVGHATGALRKTSGSRYTYKGGGGLFPSQQEFIEEIWHPELSLEVSAIDSRTIYADII